MAKKGYIGVENFVLRNLPKGYTQIEYIQSSGTQYIDTGFKPNNNTCYEIKYQTIPTTNYVGLMGADHNWGNTSFALWCKHAAYYNSTISNNVWYGENPIIMKFNKGILYKNGEKIWDASTSESFQCSYNIYLFGINRANTFTEPVSNLKIYYVKIWDNGTLVRDFIPCKNVSSTVGLYDVVNGVFYQNAGSGTFVAGSAQQKIVAHEITNCYIGINNIAKRIKKAYIGNENKKAKLWFNDKYSSISWSSSSDEDIIQMIEAADEEKIKLTDYWKIGDERTISLSNYTLDYASYTATLVLMDSVCDGFIITKTGKKPSFIVGVKEIIGLGYMNSTATNTGGWSKCERRTWCNNVFYNAISSNLKPIFKQFTWKTGQGGTDGSFGLISSNDYFALAPEKAIIGSKVSSYSNEAALYNHWEWYQTQNNQIKHLGYNNTTTWWWTSSVNDSSAGYQFIGIGTNNDVIIDNARYSNGISPFGCI